MGIWRIFGPSPRALFPIVLDFDFEYEKGAKSRVASEIIEA